jgi:hypothetical protein
MRPRGLVGEPAGTAGGSGSLCPHEACALPTQMWCQRRGLRRLWRQAPSAGSRIDGQTCCKSFLAPLLAELDQLLLRRCQLWGDSDRRGVDAQVSRWQRKSVAGRSTQPAKLTPHSRGNPSPLTGLHGCAMLLTQLVSCRGAQKPHPHSRGSGDGVGGTNASDGSLTGTRPSVNAPGLFLRVRRTLPWDAGGREVYAAERSVRSQHFLSFTQHALHAERFKNRQRRLKPRPESSLTKIDLGVNQSICYRFDFIPAFAYNNAQASQSGGDVAHSLPVVRT